MTLEPELAIERDVPQLDTAAKRTLIEAELRKDPSRADREIARIVGCDHKTVGSARERLGIASPLGNSAGTKTREQLLLETMPHIDPNSPAFKADLQKVEAAAAIEEAREKLGADEDGYHYWHIPSQARIECRALTDGGVELWQEGQHGSDEEVIIHVAAANVVMLARHMLYAAGFQNIGIYTHEDDGNVDVDDGHLASNYYVPKHGYGPVR